MVTPDEFKIARRKKKNESGRVSPVVTRSKTWDRNNLASEQVIMSESISREEFDALKSSMEAKLDRLTELILGQSSAGKGKGIEGNNDDKEESEKSETRSNHTKASATIPRYTKLDFPTFNGEEDPLSWLRKCERFFKHQNTPEHEWVGTASFHMSSKAQTWYNQLEEREPDMQWEEFKRYCSLRFGPPMRENP